MTHKEINEMIESIGYVSAYYAFPEDPEHPISPPFIVFYLDSSNNFLADNLIFKEVEHLTIELYTRTKDYEAEKRVKDALNAAGLIWSRSEAMVEDEKLFECIFETEIIIDE